MLTEAYAIYTIAGVVLSPLTTWLFVRLSREQEDVTLGLLILLFVCAILPLLNIVVFWVLGGFEKLETFFFRRVVFKRYEKS